VTAGVVNPDASDANPLCIGERLKEGFVDGQRLRRSSAEMEVAGRGLVAFGSAADPSQQVITKHATQHRPDKCRRQAPHAQARRHPENSPRGGENVTIFSEGGIAIVVSHRFSLPVCGIVNAQPRSGRQRKDTRLFFGAKAVRRSQPFADAYRAKVGREAPMGAKFVRNILILLARHGRRRWAILFRRGATR